MNVVEQFVDDVSVDVLKRTDIQFLGLQQEPWGFSRGARTIRHYKDNGTVNISDYYTYHWIEGGRKIGGLTRTIDWFDSEGNVLVSKTFNKPLSAKDIKTLNREIRQGRIDYLESGAENLRGLAETLPEPYKTQYNIVADNIDNLFDHYDIEIKRYIQRGTMDFEDAVNSETDTAILTILAIPVRQPDDHFPNGLTVKESIIHQLTGLIP